MEYQYESLKGGVKALLNFVSSNPSYPNLMTVMLADELFSAASWENGLKALEEAADNDLNLQSLLFSFYMDNKDYGNGYFWCHECAIRGVSQAQFYLGSALLSGKVMGKDSIEAVFWLNKAAHNHNPQAHRLLADCYKIGLGVNPDFGMAAHHFQEYQKYRDQDTNEPVLEFNDHKALEIKIHLDKFLFFKNQERFEGEAFNEKADYEINVLVNLMLDNNYTFSSLQNYLTEKLGKEMEGDIVNKTDFLKRQISRCDPFEGKDALFDK